MASSIKVPHSTKKSGERWMQGHDPTTCKHNERALEVGDLLHPTELNGATTK
jgi:hypothetical protein